MDLPIGGTGYARMQARNLDPVVNHDLMRPVGIQTDIGSGNVICVSDVEVLIDL